MLVYTRNSLFAIRNSWQTTLKCATSHGSAPRPISREVWLKLLSCNVLATRRGQRGGNHLRQTKEQIIRTVNITIREKNLSHKKRNCININNLLNIQTVTSTNNVAHSTLKENNKYDSGLKLIHLNIRSVRNDAHLHQLREFSKLNSIDVLTISESWLNSTVTNKEIEIDGYRLHRLDRVYKKGGGVCTYVRKEIKSFVVKELTQISDSSFHQLWINVQVKKSKSLLVCTSYRPPDCPLACFEDFLKPTTIQALIKGKPIVILGDLNCNMLVDCPENKALSETAAELNLKQIITTPTRITDTSESLIDVILVSSPSLIRNSGVLSTPISDHLPVYVSLKMKSTKPKPSYITVRSYKNYVPNVFTANLAARSDNLLSIFTTYDVNDKLSILNDTLQSTLNSHAPIKTIKIRTRSCPFVNLEIKKLMRERDQLFRLFVKTRDARDWDNYKTARNNVKTILVNARREHTLNEVYEHKNNPGSLWKIIKENIPLQQRDIVVYSKDEATVADEFNQYFASVGKNAAQKASQLARDNKIQTTTETFATSTDYYPDSPAMFNFSPVSCEQVRRTITSMASNKSPGIDKVSMRVIKDCLSVILGPLTDVINQSLASSTFPEAWKIAEVIPLPKEDDHEIPSNNRPISLLPVASKICEKIALDQFSTYLTVNNRLTPHQSGCRKHHSTETLNILVGDAVLKAMEQKSITALILLDLSKAFDSLSHPILLEKIRHIGASISAVKWFQSYLSGRSQCVRIGQAVSSPRPITHGVPQGAILSPLLFSIYLNDLPSSLNHCNLESYVDDSKVFMAFPVKNNEEAKRQLEEDLHLTAKWCLQNQLLINPHKTKFLLIGTWQMLKKLPSDMSLNFLGELIQPVESAKDLGILVDSRLTYDLHISHLAASCTSKLIQINRVKKSFDTGTLSLLISALVISKLLYCSTVWSNTSAKNVKKLQLVQNFACRIITNTRKFDHISPALQYLNWLPINKQLKFREAVLMYKIMNKQAPSYLCDKFQKKKYCRTRNSNNLQIPLFKSKSGQRTFEYRGVKIWNNLNNELKSEISLTTFKHNLKKALIAEK